MVCVSSESTDENEDQCELSLVRACAIELMNSAAAADGGGDNIDDETIDFRLDARTSDEGKEAAAALAATDDENDTAAADVAGDSETCGCECGCACW